MRPCGECGRSFRDPRTRHLCPHGHICIGPSIHSVATILKPNGTTRADRQLYCSGCSSAHYPEEPVTLIQGEEKLTERQLVERWSINRRTLLRWRTRRFNPIPHFLVGRSIWYKTAEVESWLRLQQPSPRPHGS